MIGKKQVCAAAVVVACDVMLEETAGLRFFTSTPGAADAAAPAAGPVSGAAPALLPRPPQGSKYPRPGLPLPEGQGSSSSTSQALRQENRALVQSLIVEPDAQGFDAPPPGASVTAEGATFAPVRAGGGEMESRRILKLTLRIPKENDRSITFYQSTGSNSGFAHGWFLLTGVEDDWGQITRFQKGGDHSWADSHQQAWGKGEKDQPTCVSHGSRLGWFDGAFVLQALLNAQAERWDVEKWNEADYFCEVEFHGRERGQLNFMEGFYQRMPDRLLAMTGGGGAGGGDAMRVSPAGCLSGPNLLKFIRDTLKRSGQADPEHADIGFQGFDGTIFNEADAEKMTRWMAIDMSRHKKFDDSGSPTVNRDALAEHKDLNLLMLEIAAVLGRSPKTLKEIRKYDFIRLLEKIGDQASANLGRRAFDMLRGAAGLLQGA